MECIKLFLRRRFIAILSHFRKQEKSETNNINLHLKQVEKEQSLTLVEEIKKLENK